MTLLNDYVKILTDRLTDEKVQALLAILSSMVLLEEETSPEEALEINQARAEIKAGNYVRAEDAWHELGI